MMWNRLMTGFKAREKGRGGVGAGAGVSCGGGNHEVISWGHVLAYSYRCNPYG